MGTLHIHADEAGNFDFHRKGSRYYSFAVVWTEDPYPIADQLRALRFDLLKRGIDVPAFHAQNDNLRVRHQVYEILSRTEGWQFCAVVVDKARVFPALQAPQRFYPTFLAPSLRFILRSRQTALASSVLICTDSIPNMKRKKGVEKAIKLECGHEIPKGKTFHVYHHPSASNFWLQVADYCCWAVHRKHEHSDDSYYRLIEHRMAKPELKLWH